MPSFEAISLFFRAAAAAQEAGILCARFGSTNFFDDDSMFPVVTKIVDVTELGYS